MGISWKDFEMPKRLECEESSLTNVYGKFIAEPFERGYGMTIGNSLRRVLLSSIEGAAVTSIRIENVLHEFSTVQGVLEDVTQIVLNVKQLVVRSHSRSPKVIRIDVTKEGLVTAADIQTDDTVEVINPEQHIATITEKTAFKMEMEVGRGRGYCPAERNKREDLPVHAIPIDSMFSPVTKVNFSVEDTRVGQMTDYDRLLLEITTNGSMSPKDALLYASNILKGHLDIFVNFGKLPEEEEPEESDEDRELKEKLAQPVSELELSVRSANCLREAKIVTIGDLVSKPEPEMLKYRNFGKKSLNEISEILVGMGLSLGMNVQAESAEQKEVNDNEA